MSQSRIFTLNSGHVGLADNLIPRVDIAVLIRMRYRLVAQVHELRGFSHLGCTSYVQEPL